MPGLQTELEVGNSFDDVCLYGQGEKILPADYTPVGVNRVKTMQGSRDWKISMTYAKADVVTLDNQLDN